MVAVRKSVVGAEELSRNLKALGKNIGARHIDPAMRAALKPILKTAQEKAVPRRQPHTANGEHLDQNLVISPGLMQSRTRRVQRVSAKGRAMKIAHLVELGTLPHWQPKRGIMHPGARPYPFLRPAVDEHADETIVTLGKELFRRVEADVLKMYAGKATKIVRR
jgi:hypothetical protein